MRPVQFRTFIMLQNIPAQREEDSTVKSTLASGWFLHPLK